MRDLAKPALPLFANAHFIVNAYRTCYIPDYLILKPRDAVGWARRSLHTPISGSDRDETLERIQGWFTPSANEK